MYIKAPACLLVSAEVEKGVCLWESQDFFSSDFFNKLKSKWGLRLGFRPSACGAGLTLLGGGGADLCSEVAGHGLPLQLTWLCLLGVVQAPGEEIRGNCWFCLSRQKVLYLVLWCLTCKYFASEKFFSTREFCLSLLSLLPKKRCSQRVRKASLHTVVRAYEFSIFLESLIQLF